MRHPAGSDKARLARPDRREDHPSAFVVLGPRDLAALDASGRSMAAGIAGVSEAEVARCAAAGEPLVVDAMPRIGDARARAQALRAETGLAVHAVGSWTDAVARASGCGGSLAAGAVAITALGAALAWLPMVIVAALASAVAGLVGVWALLTDVTGYRAATSSWGTARERALPPDVARVASRIAALRRRVHSASIPGAATRDLRDDLLQIEEQLTALAGIARIADEALARTDLDRLRLRLVALTAEVATRPGLAAERDQVAAIVGDLQDIASRRQRARAEIARMETALDAVDGLLGRTALAEDVEPGA